MRDNSSSSLSESALLAIGGRYDHLLHHLWELENVGREINALSFMIAPDLEKYQILFNSFFSFFQENICAYHVSSLMHLVVFSCLRLMDFDVVRF